jgi:uncharacterized protein YbjT (DUF2867 family)
MKVVIFGATGMVGQGVLLECLRDPGVETILTVVRKPSGSRPPNFPNQEKIRELVHADFQDFTAIEPELIGLDACFFCLGAGSSGMSEADYTRITYGITVAAIRALLKASPNLTFIFISGEGSDSTEKSRIMWARVKGKAENAVLSAGFKSAYVFRPGFIEALDGIESATPLYRKFYKFLRPLMPLLKKLMPKRITSTQQIGRAMLRVTRNGFATRILTTADLTTFLSP